MTRAKTYEIYVSASHGWKEGCPSYESVFFAPEGDQTYIHPADGGHSEAGSLIIVGGDAARAKLGDLQTTGDWGTDEGDIDRPPEYAMREWRGNKSTDARIEAVERIADILEDATAGDTRDERERKYQALARIAEGAKARGY